MKAIQIVETGAPNVLTYTDVPKPTLKPDHVLIKIHAVGLNPVDFKIRSAPQMPPWIKLPAILGWDVSGVVEESASDTYQVGDEVYGMVNFPGYGGAYAEYVLAPSDHIAHKPKSLNHIQSAGVPLAALTAYQAFELSELSAGQRVLIHAGAGGVGHFAIQLAKLRGATVVTTASERNHTFLRDLGADEIIDYRNVDFETVATEIDMVLQTIGGTHGQKSIQTMKDGGKLVTIVGDANIEPERDIQILPMLVEPSAQQLQHLAKWLDNGDLKVHIQETFALQDVAKAHESLETGHTRGKIVLEIV